MAAVEIWSVEASRSEAARLQASVDEYVKRAGRYAAVAVREFRNEAAFAAAWEKLQRGNLILLERGGKAMDSEGWARDLQSRLDAGVRTLVYGIGPPSGWSQDALGRADGLISLGAITLPHQLALLVTVEQVYRALTILAGHPYHCGH